MSPDTSPNVTLANRLLLFRSRLATRILVPLNVISILALTAMGYVMVRYNVTSVSQALESKIEFAANFLQHSGTTYLSNYDLVALEEFVRISERDPDVAYAVFVDSLGKPLTKGSKARPTGGDIGVLTRELRDTEGKTLGTIQVGFNRSRQQQAVQATFVIVSVCILLVQLVLTLTMLTIVRSVTQSLKLAVDRLSHASSTISRTSEELSSNSDSISRGVTKQAAAVEQTAGSMAAMSSKLAQTAENAQACYALAGKVTDKSANGMEIMQRMVGAMSTIESANAQLQDMVGIIRGISAKTNVINEIVFKTQLLSLNASIEAARAGQHGRGFAVVAEEVGNLAQLSGNAAKEISALLERSVQDVAQIVKSTEDRVKEGRQVSDHALKTFNEIAADINSISQQLQSISEATREQDRGVDQASKAMVTVAEATEMNNAIANGAQGISRVLGEQSKHIADITRSIRRLILGVHPIPSQAAPQDPPSEGEAMLALESGTRDAERL